MPIRHQLIRFAISLTLSFTWKFRKMDGFTDKKWFVYIGDHHEGPFSLEDIQGKMAQGQVTRNSYVWAEGMADWKAMIEMSEFGSLTTSVSNSGATSLNGGGSGLRTFDAPAPGS